MLLHRKSSGREPASLGNTGTKSTADLDCGFLPVKSRGLSRCEIRSAKPKLLEACPCFYSDTVSWFAVPCIREEPPIMLSIRVAIFLPHLFVSVLSTFEIASTARWLVMIKPSYLHRLRITQVVKMATVQYPLEGLVRAVADLQMRKTAAVHNAEGSSKPRVPFNE